jgi:toxin ParE1/3/4
MRRKVIILDPAEQDIKEAIEYYNSHSRKAKDDFLFVLDVTFSLIGDTPEAFPFSYNPVRKCVVEKFPFVIHYFEEKETIYVLAVFHDKRNPGNLKKRFKV